MFRTPKRNQQRPPKKGHKAEQEKDIKGVGVRGEVTPESRSTSDIPGIMGKTTAEPDQPGQSSRPYAKLKHESSEDAKSQVQFREITHLHGSLAESKYRDVAKKI